VIKRNLGEYFSEKFTDTWKLLSDTNLFLSQAGILEKYDDELRNIRPSLQKLIKNSEDMKKVREEIINLRSRLRYQGLDLSLSGQSLFLTGSGMIIRKAWALSGLWFTLPLPAFSGVPIRPIIVHWQGNLKDNSKTLIFMIRIFPLKAVTTSGIFVRVST
jgi:hypothetical protein